MNLFKNINETNLAGGNLNDVLNNLDLGGLIIGAVDKSMGKYRNTFESVTDLARGDVELQKRAETNLASFDKNIRKARIYDSDNKYKMTVGNRRKWNNYADDILFGDNEQQKKEWVSDIAGMSIAFKNDVNFAERVYRSGLENQNITYTDKEIKTFRSKISSSEQYRFDIATAITAQRGFQAGSPAGTLTLTDEYYDYDTDEKIYEKYSYNRYKGDVSAVLGEGIKFNPQTNGYITDKSWDLMNPETQQDSFDLRVREIASGKVSPRAKRIMLEKLFSDIPNPYNLTYQEYMDEKASEILTSKEVNFLSPNYASKLLF